MICEKCDKPLRIVRTVTAGPSNKVQEGECEGCHRRFTCVSFIFREIEGYGTGAQAVAAQLKKGKLVMEQSDGR